MLAEFKATNFQNSKQLVLNYYADLDRVVGAEDVTEVMSKYIADDYLWRGMHPFNVHNSVKSVAEVFWQPLKHSFTKLQRRADIFFAGLNQIDEFNSQWVCQVGHLMGLFDNEWLGIAPTGKMLFIRFAEFHRVVADKIVETALFIDIPAIMRQAGYNPFIADTGAFFIQPGPLTHDGLQFDDADSKISEITLNTIELMNDNVLLGRRDKSTDGLGDAWCDDMIWFGPSGIGATYTKQRYQLQHRKPLIDNMDFDVPNHGTEIQHICRMAEGTYGGFFGWPNFYALPKGNFMGLPATDKLTEFRVVDIYRVVGGKIAENWVFMDLLHFMKVQGVDVLENMQIRNNCCAGFKG